MKPLKKYDSVLWGEINQPENFIELMTYITQNQKPSINVRYWRGQADITWQLTPSIVRKIKLEEYNRNKSGKELDKSIAYWESILLNKAKKNLYNYDDCGRQLNDIELLAKLQHYGAATRLLDFSKNVLIALWFCIFDPQYKNTTGLLLGIDTDIMSGMENEFDFEINYSDFSNEVSKSNNICIVDSPAIVSRISSQNSVFLCSKSVDDKHGTFMLPDSEWHKKVIAISPQLKSECLKILSECFNITPLTIYPDIEGFANANSTRWKLSEFTRW